MVSFFRSLDALLGRISRLFIILGGLMTVCMIFVTTYGVVMRYFFRRPEPVSYEIATVFLLWGYLFGIAFVEWRGEHIRADIFVPLMPKRLVHALHRIVAHVLALIYVAILTWKGWSVAMYSYSIGEKSMSVWQEPLFPIKIMIPICYALLTLVVFRNLCHGIAAYGSPTGGEDREESPVVAPI
jgi:TRAP-type C4-dicarboxylate transport system permease small subunit